MITIEKDEYISKVINKLLKNEPVIVTDKGKFVGVIDYRVVKFINADKTKVAKVTKTITAIKDLEPEHILEAYIEYPEFVVRVDDKDKPIEIIDKNQVIKIIKDYLPQAKVMDVYHSNITIVNEDEDIQKADEIMRKNNSDVILIQSKNKIIGYLDHEDVFVIKYWLSNPEGKKDIKKETKKSIKIKEILYKTDIGSASLLDDVQKLFQNPNYLYVVYSRSPIGVVFMRDLAKLSLRNIRTQYSNIYIVGLPEEDSYLRQDIFDELNRLKKSLESRNKNYPIYLKIKNHGKSYELKLTIVGEPSVYIEDEGYDLISVLKSLIKTALLKYERLKR